MRVAIYARVSRREQQTLPLQLKAMRQYASIRKWKVRLQVEDVRSGVKERKKREQIMDAARRREIDAVIVWKLDRWGRSLHDLFDSMKELNDLGVRFVSVTELIDLTTPAAGPDIFLVKTYAKVFDNSKIAIFTTLSYLAGAQ